MRTLNKDKATLFALAPLMVLLSACSRGISNENTERLILPTIVEYSGEEQESLARELQSGACPISKKFIIDYGIMRDQTREALK